MMRNTLLRTLVLSSISAWAAGLGGSGVALAGDQTISVLGLEPAAGAPESVASTVTEALRQRATATAGYRLVQGRDLVEVKLVFSCPDEAPPCMTQAAQSIGANKVIFGNVQPVGTDAFLVTLKLLDSQRGVVESWISEQIAKVQTTPISLRGPVQKWFGTLTGQAIPGSLKLTGGVIGAGVWVDGVQSGLLGAGGLTISGVVAGPHHLAVTKAGYEKFERNITMASGATESVAVQLSAIDGADGAEAGPAGAMDLSSPLTTPPPESTGSTKVGSLIAGYALAGLGIASVGFGIYSSSRISDVNSKLDKYRRYPCVSGAGDICKSDGKTVIGARTAAEDQYVKDQQSTGNTYSSLQWVGYGVGAAALVGSVMLLVHGYSNDSSSATASASHSNLLVMPSFSPDGAGAMAYLTF